MTVYSSMINSRHTLNILFGHHRRHIHCKTHFKIALQLVVADTFSVILATHNPPIFRWFVHTHFYPFMVKLGWFTINYCFTNIKSSKLQWLQVQMLPPLNKNRGSRWLSWKRSFPGGHTPRDLWKIRSAPQKMQILGPPFQANGPFSLSVLGFYIIGYLDHPDLNQMNKHLRGLRNDLQ